MTSAFAFVKELGDFSYELSGLDHVWNILFPDAGKKWNHLHVRKYKHTFYITHVAGGGGGGGGLEVEPKKDVKAVHSMGAPSYSVENHGQLTTTWEPLIVSARKWLRVARKDWMRANKRIQVEYPLHCRYGVAPNAFVRASLPDVYRLDKELGKDRTWKLVSLVEDGFFLESLSGREMYSQYADGRHDGLLDIDPASEQEFADWIDGTHPKRGGGGHPWEIKRGGNTTHIDLTVLRQSLYLGIIPSYASLHRANQHFDQDEEVYDVMYYNDLGRFKRRITPFVRWEPLPILKPRDA